MRRIILPEWQPGRWDAEARAALGYTTEILCDICRGAIQWLIQGADLCFCNAPQNKDATSELAAFRVTLTDWGATELGFATGADGRWAMLVRRDDRKSIDAESLHRAIWDASEKVGPADPVRRELARRVVDDYWFS